jgi:glucan 1,3-beta-glucosidase
MSFPNRDGPSRDIAYGPLPSTNDDHPGAFHPSPSRSPEPHSLSYHTPQLEPGSRELPPIPPSESVETFPDAALYSAYLSGLRPNSFAPSHIPSYHTPEETELANRALLDHDDGPPLDVAPRQPRFIGAALYNEPGMPRHRSSQASMPSVDGNSERDSSVYALNDARTYGSAYFDEQNAYRDDPNEGYNPGMGARNRYLDEKRVAYTAPRTVSKRKFLLWVLFVGGVVIIAGVLVPIYFFVIKPKGSPHVSSPGHSAAAPQPSGTSRPGNPSVAITGGDGSTVTMDDGTTFIYNNPFGGYWYYDPQDPFNDAARAQSFTPALNETFNYGIDKIRGSECLFFFATKLI